MRNRGLNKIDFQKKCKEKCDLIKKISQKKDIYIWGTGQGACILYPILKEHHIEVKGFIYSFAKKNQFFMSKKVYGTEILKKENVFPVISLMQYDRDIINTLFNAGYSLRKDMIYIYETDESEILKDDIEYRGCKSGKYTYGYKELLYFFPLAKSIGRYCSINGTAKIWNNHPNCADKCCRRNQSDAAKSRGSEPLCRHRCGNWKDKCSAPCCRGRAADSTSDPPSDKSGNRRWRRIGSQAVRDTPHGL